jgi:hypothetical protein
MTAKKKSHRRRPQRSFHHPVVAVTLPIYTLQGKRLDVLILQPEE